MGGLAGLAGRLGPSQRSAFFTRLLESVGNNDERLIIGNQADLLSNLTPWLRPGKASPLLASEEDE